MPKRRLVACIPLFLFLACDSPPTSVEVSPTLVPDAVLEASTTGPTRFIVVGAGNQLASDIDAVIERAGGTVVATIPQLGIAVVESSADFLGSIEGNRSIAAAMPDFLVEIPDDMAGEDLNAHDPIPAPFGGDLRDLLWGLDAVDAPAAWAAGNTGAGVRVAVLDAGIDHDHPDLAPNLNSDLSASFSPCLGAGLNCDGPVEDWRISPGFYFNHGSHTAGTIAAAADGAGVTGVAPGAEIVAVKVCTEFANACFTSAILAGLVYAADIEADVVNMSLGGIRRMRNDFVRQCKLSGLPTTYCASLAGQNRGAQAGYVASTITVYRRAFEYASQAGTTVIVSAGNSGVNFDRMKDYWAAFADFPHTIGVSALGPVGWCQDMTTSVDGLAYYSSYGQSIVDVSAPGGNFEGAFIPLDDLCTVAGITRVTWAFDGVMSTISEGWGWAQGTSMAAPHAAGIAALIISANGGDMSPSQVERQLKGLAEDLGSPGHDAVYGAGRVRSGY